MNERYALDLPLCSIYLRGMLESTKAAGLIEEWRRHEARIVEIKKELASLLGVSPSVVAMPTKGQAQLPLPSDEQESDSTVAPGTKGRATIEAIHSFGGRSNAGGVRDALVAKGLVTADAQGMKNIRSYFAYLRKKEYIVAVKGHRGTWALTPKATAVLGGAP